MKKIIKSIQFTPNMNSKQKSNLPSRNLINEVQDKLNWYFKELDELVEKQAA